MRAETEMIDQASRWSDTVCLRLEALTTGLHHEPLCGSSAARTIDYRKSWLRALPRIVIGIPTILMAANFIWIPVAFLSPQYIGQTLRVGVLIVAIVSSAIAYFSVFVRPTINREAKVALRSVLRAGR
jgi:hypothetical protein